MANKRKNGEGTFGSNGKGWDFIITLGKKENGKPHRKTFYGATKELAKAKYEAWLQEQVYAVPESMSDWTLGTWAEYWFDKIARKRCKETTISDDRSILNAHILPSLGSIKLKDLTWKTLQKFYDDLAEKPNGRGGTLSAKTVKNVYIVINRILKKACKLDLIPKNPNENVELPKTVRNKPKRSLDIEVQEKLSNYCLKEDTTMALLIVFLMGTGLRLGESLGLQWSKVNFEDNFIKIEQQLQAIEDKAPDAKHKNKLQIIDSTKTTSSIRELPIAEDLVKLLKHLKVKYNKNKMKLGVNYINKNLVFGKDNGDFICDTVLRKHFNDILEKLNIPHTRLHDLRHTFATTACEVGKVEDVSAYLGHKSIVTTVDMYIHADRKKLKSLAYKMGSRFRKEKEDSRKIACEDNEKKPS